VGIGLTLCKPSQFLGLEPGSCSLHEGVGLKRGRGTARKTLGNPKIEDKIVCFFRQKFLPFFSFATLRVAKIDRFAPEGAKKCTKKIR
jgi:hypothetical protein